MTANCHLIFPALAKVDQGGVLRQRPRRADNALTSRTGGIRETDGRNERSSIATTSGLIAHSINHDGRRHRSDVKPTIEADPSESRTGSSGQRFHRLHETPTPLRLVNAWIALARVFSLAGAPAIGTSSFAVVLAHGYWDGQQIPWTVAQEVVAEIVNAAGDLPVTADIESGRGHTTSEVAATVDDVISVGAVGVNIEDSLPGSPGELFRPGDSVRSAASCVGRRGASLASIVHQRTMRRLLRSTGTTRMRNVLASFWTEPVLTQSRAQVALRSGPD